MTEEQELLPKQPNLTPMFVFDIKHVEYKNATPISKVAHKECMENGYNLLPNYTVSVDRQTEVPRARCEFCGGRYDEVKSVQIEEAITKWLVTGDRTDYSALMAEQQKVSVTDYNKSLIGRNLNIPRGTQTGRTQCTEPNYSAKPKSNMSPQDVIAKLRKRTGVQVGGVQSGDATIVTNEEKRLSEMSKLTDDELFNQ